MTAPNRDGMSAATAKTIEYGIIALCLAALAMIFQPFSIELYGIGAGLVVLAGLAFNLIPLCVPGKPLSSVVKAAFIVLAILVVVFLLAVSAAYLYGVYLQSTR